MLAGARHFMWEQYGNNSSNASHLVISFSEMLRDPDECRAYTWDKLPNPFLKEIVLRKSICPKIFKSGNIGLLLKIFCRI